MDDEPDHIDASKLRVDPSLFLRALFADPRAYPLRQIFSYLENSLCEDRTAIKQLVHIFIYQELDKPEIQWTERASEESLSSSSRLEMKLKISVFQLSDVPLDDPAMASGICIWLDYSMALKQCFHQNVPFGGWTQTLAKSLALPHPVSSGSLLLPLIFAHIRKKPSPCTLCQRSRIFELGLSPPAMFICCQ